MLIGLLVVEMVPSHRDIWNNAEQGPMDTSKFSFQLLSAATAQWGGHHPTYLYGYKGNKCLSIILFDSWK